MVHFRQRFQYENFIYGAQFKDDVNVFENIKNPKIEFKNSEGDTIFTGTIIEYHVDFHNNFLNLTDIQVNGRKALNCEEILAVFKSFESYRYEITPNP